MESKIFIKVIPMTCALEKNCFAGATFEGFFIRYRYRKTFAKLLHFILFKILLM